MLVPCSPIESETDNAAPCGIVRTDMQSAAHDFVTETLCSPSALGVVNPGKDKHFYSKGAFNLVQLILYLLKQSGPAHIFMSSYSIAEESLATLKRYCDKGTILSIRFLIDNRVRTISPKPFDYLVTSFPGAYRCTALHAKVALIYNDHVQWTVVGSQNATRNPKLERGIIHTSKDVFDFDLKMMTDEFDAGTT